MNQDFRDLIAEFNAHKVEFLVVGAHALAAHGCVRATKDLDLWVRPELANAKHVVSALRAFGAPLHDLTETDLTTAGVTFQVGLPPLRIDILTAITGVEFEDARPHRMQTKFADQPVGVLSKQHLLQNKRAAGRKQDLALIRNLGFSPVELRKIQHILKENEAMLLEKWYARFGR